MSPTNAKEFDQVRLNAAKTLIDSGIVELVYVRADEDKGLMYCTYKLNDAKVNEVVDGIVDDYNGTKAYPDEN